LNIVVVSQYFWPESFRINDVVLGLRQRGHDVRVLTGLPNYPFGKFFPSYSIRGPYTEELNGARISRVPLVPRGNGGRLRLALNYSSFALLATLIGPWRIRRPADVILVYEPSPVTVGIPALLLKAWLKVPVMFWVQDLWPQSLEATGAVTSRAALHAVDSLVRFIYRHCDRILVQSEAFIDPVREQGVPNQRISYLPNAAEDFYRPISLPPDAPERAELPEGFRVVFAGNIGAAQDFGTILEAAERTRQDAGIHWLVFGDGRLKDWVAGEIERRNLGATVHLLGSRAAEQMPRYFALADALLVTLRRDPIFSYTIPSKVQSYLACGRPIVAALDGEGARVVEESGAGYVVPTQDSAALADAVIRMRQLGEAERVTMGRSATDYFARHFERGLVLDQLENSMGDTVKDGRCAS